MLRFVQLWFAIQCFHCYLPFSPLSKFTWSMNYVKKIAIWFIPFSCFHSRSLQLQQSHLVLQVGCLHGHVLHQHQHLLWTILDCRKLKENCILRIRICKVFWTKDKYKPAELKDTKANTPMIVNKFMMKSQLRYFVSFASSL